MNIDGYGSNQQTNYNEESTVGDHSFEDQALPPLLIPSLSNLHSPTSHEHLALKIDKYSSIFFPALFALFNVFYWYHYLVE